MKKDYAFSGWIANLGVVPLFSLAFFLLLPAFFLFNFLLIRVCVVFEDIIFSLIKIVKRFNKIVLLSRLSVVVKVFLLIFSISIPVNAAEQEFFLAKGEQLELSVENLKNFSVGNPEVIKYKLLKNSNKILIKGKSLGFSDLVIWSTSGKRKTHHFYVSSKKEQMGKMVLAEIFQKAGLKTSISGKMVHAEGIVNTIKGYMEIKKIQTQNPKNLSLNISISDKLRTQIIEKLYNEFYEQGGDQISCKENHLLFRCHISSKVNISHLTSFYKNHYFIDFTSYDLDNQYSNLKLKFQFIAIEDYNINSSGTDYSHIDTQVKDLLSKGRLFKGDSLFLKNQKIKISSAASPVINIIYNKDFTIQLGGEVPITKKVDDQIITDWKFIGLQVKGKLEINENQTLLAYNSFLTQSVAERISGPKGSSFIYMKKNKHQKLYSIDLNQSSTNKSKTPLLGDIPGLGVFFSENSDQVTKKKIIVYAQLQDDNEI